MGRGSLVGESTLEDDVLESMFKLRIRDSDQLKTTSALYNQDTVQKGEPVSCTRAKNVVKKNLA